MGGRGSSFKGFKGTISVTKGGKPKRYSYLGPDYVRSPDGTAFRFPGGLEAFSKGLKKNGYTIKKVSEKTLQKEAAERKKEKRSNILGNLKMNKRW